MDKKCAQLWQQLSAALKPQISADSFKRWFSAVELVEAKDKSLTLRVPNNIYQFWIESNYMPALQTAIVTTLGSPRPVKFCSPSGTTVQMPVEDAAPLEKILPEPPANTKPGGTVPGLNPRNTYESFEVGPNNEIAHAAALAVSLAPARTFNTLFDGHKQIVLSSDRPASEIANLEHRLVSRFEWGLTAELQPPDIETRMAILRKKAYGMQIRLHDEVFQFLASRIRTNVRRLEGALMRVASFASLSGKELTQEVVEHLLKDILQEEGRHSITIEQIQRRVAEHFDVRVADMTSKRRPASIAFPRQVAMFLARELTKASLNEIGDAFGGRDHGTVLHACKLVKKRMAEQDNLRQTISFID